MGVQEVTWTEVWQDYAQRALIEKAIKEADESDFRCSVCIQASCVCELEDGEPDGI